MENIKYLLPAEKEELFKAIEQVDHQFKVRNKAMFSLALYCGLRASEVALIKEENLDIENRTIYCERLKGSRNTYLYISDDYVIKNLSNYLLQRKLNEVNDDTLFLSEFKKPISRQQINYLMKYYCSFTNIPKDKWMFSTLKHTRALEILSESGNIMDVNYGLGHKNMANSKLYSKILDNEEAYKNYKSRLKLYYDALEKYKN